MKRPRLLSAGLITVANTKNGDLRTVPMAAPMRTLLLSLPRPLDSSARVFPHRKALVLTRSFARLCARLGVANLAFHDLRHDVGSRPEMAGVRLRAIADILGHRKLEMTLRYAHLAPAHLREAMTVLAPAQNKKREVSQPRALFGGLDGT